MSEAAWRHWGRRLETLESELAAEIFAKIVDGERHMPAPIVESLARLAQAARRKYRRDLACSHYLALARGRRIAAIESEAMVWFGQQLMHESKASWAEELAREWLSRRRRDSTPVADFLRSADLAVRQFVEGQLPGSYGARSVQRRMAQMQSATSHESTWLWESLAKAAANYYSAFGPYDGEHHMPSCERWGLDEKRCTELVRRNAALLLPTLERAEKDAARAEVVALSEREDAWVKVVLRGWKERLDE
jgi:hypothetical protein